MVGSRSIACHALFSWRNSHRLFFLYSGMKIFKAAPKTAPVSYKLVSMILACTGGGILVPIFLNGIPVPLANDAYPIAILTSFAIHHYFPIIGEVVDLSPWVKVGKCLQFYFSLLHFSVCRQGEFLSDNLMPFNLICLASGLSNTIYFGVQLFTSNNSSDNL